VFTLSDNGCLWKILYILQISCNSDCKIYTKIRTFKIHFLLLLDNNLWLSKHSNGDGAEINVEGVQMGLKSSTVSLFSRNDGQ